jgi:hypothetical protein
MAIVLKVLLKIIDRIFQSVSMSTERLLRIRDTSHRRYRVEAPANQPQQPRTGIRQE